MSNAALDRTQMGFPNLPDATCKPSGCADGAEYSRQRSCEDDLAKMRYSQQAGVDFLEKLTIQFDLLLNKYLL